jgi:hypothetical protein
MDLGLCQFTRPNVADAICVGASWGLTGAIAAVHARGNGSGQLPPTRRILPACSVRSSTPLARRPGSGFSGPAPAGQRSTGREVKSHTVENLLQ